MRTRHLANPAFPLAFPTGGVGPHLCLNTCLVRNRLLAHRATAGAVFLFSTDPCLTTGSTAQLTWCLNSQHLFWCLNTCYLTQKSVSMLNQHPCNYLHARVWSIMSSVSNDFVGTSLGGSYVHACPLPSSSSSVADTEWPRAILRRSIHRLATIHPPPAASRSNTKSTLLARAPKPASEWSPISTCISASRNGTS